MLTRAALLATIVGRGVAPAIPSGAGSVGTKQVVKYQADYIFYRAS